MIVKWSDLTDVVHANGALIEPGVVGDHHAAFTAGDIFIVLEAETTDVAESAEVLVLESCATALGDVFQNFDFGGRGLRGLAYPFPRRRPGNA